MSFLFALALAVAADPSLPGAKSKDNGPIVSDLLITTTLNSLRITFDGVVSQGTVGTVEGGTILLDVGKLLGDPKKDKVKPVDPGPTIEVLVTLKATEARFQEQSKKFGKPGDKATHEDLQKQLRTWIDKKTNVTLVLKGDADVPFGLMLSLTDTCQAVGITRVTFALNSKTPAK